MTTTTTDKYETRLRDAGIRITAIRLLVLRTIADDPDGIFSLADLAARITTLDSSTLFRTLSLFAQHHLVHEVDDGSGMQKYCVCHCDDPSHHHGHIHLTCLGCHRTFCLRDVPIPSVAIPAGFAASEAEYVVKGFCSDCQKKQHL
ncbi:MAG: transcriptional repressor [Bacteroidales bacterium]|nr:transcriptional repressor [Bacteroidales bacterium]